MIKPLVSAGVLPGIIFALGLWLASGSASADKREVSELPLVFAESVTGPRLAALDAAFDREAAAWESGCQSPDALRGGFHAASDAWARMELFKSGPLSRQSRLERISYWPDPRNTVTRGLKTLLDGVGEDGLRPEQIAGASVAVQGLPALERLLYPDRGSEGASDALSARQCAVGRAIARNLRTIAANAFSEWTKPETGDLARSKSASAGSGTAGETASAVLGDIATGIRILEDRKIPPLFGGRGVVPNEKSAEGWRSKRSERDLALNIEALRDALKAVEPFAPEAAAAANEKLADAAAALAAPPDPNRAVAIIAAINNAKYYVVDVLPGELGVALGFNSMDGD